MHMKMYLTYWRKNMKDNAWLSDRAKTWIVTITMVTVVGGMGYGYYKLKQYVDRPVPETTHTWASPKNNAKIN